MNVPYEKQGGTPLMRMCGAACLCMVYRSFGADHSQDDVWSYLARSDQRGSCARTHLLAADALRRGFSALVVQACDPWGALQVCAGHSIRAVLNHRLAPAAAEGHYTVLVDVSDDQAILHDPQVGPAIPLDRFELLELWKAGSSVSEIRGRVLVVFAEGPAAPVRCRVCGTAVPLSFPCRRCRKTVPLHPAVVLGCAILNCRGRLWERLFCPFCDTEVTELPGPLSGDMA